MDSLTARLDAMSIDRRTARIHEAAHAVAADALGMEPSVRIIAVWGRWENSREPGPDVEADPSARIAMLMAGGAAETVFGFASPWAGARQDLRAATEIMRAKVLADDAAIRAGIFRSGHIVTPDALARARQHAHDSAFRSAVLHAGELVSRHRYVVAALADVLEEHSGILETPGTVRSALDEARSRARRRTAPPDVDAAVAATTLAMFAEQGRLDVAQHAEYVRTAERISSREPAHAGSPAR